jgi:hypothetical protein
MLNPRRQGRLCIRLCHRQLQASERGGGRAYELGRKSTLGTLHAWVRRHFRSPRSGVLTTTHGRGILAEHGVRLHTVGKTHLFPPEVQAALAKAEELTKNNHR